MKRRKFLPWWKERYREDIGRGRHRRYPLENIFGADLSSMQAFRALGVKLARDYLIFFRILEKAYPVGELGEEAKAALKLVISTLRLVERSIASGVPRKEDVEDIVANVDVLNAQRDFFVQRAEEDRDLKERIEQTEEETGVSPEALGITEKAIRRGARIERKRARRRASPRARGMPRTRKLGAELGKGLGVAALGPFYRIAEMLSGPLLDIYGLGRGMLRRRGERRLRESFRPTGYPEEQGMGLGGILPKVFGYPEERRVGPQAEPLWQFFNKEAYRAKWTKELLQRIKELGRVQKEKGGLLDDLSAWLLPLVGKAGLFAALAVGVGWAVTKFNELKDVWGGLEKVRKGRKEAAETLGQAAEMKLGAVREMGLSEYARKAGKSPRQVAMDIAGMEQREKLERWAGRPWWKRSISGLAKISPVAAIAQQIIPGLKKPEIEPFYPRVEEIERIGARVPVGLAARVAAGYAPGAATNELIKGILGLSTEVKSLSNQIGPRRTQPSIKEPGLGDPFDSADALLSEYTSGRLTLEER